MLDWTAHSTQTISFRVDGRQGLVLVDRWIESKRYNQYLVLKGVSVLRVHCRLMVRRLARCRSRSLEATAGGFGPERFLSTVAA